MRCYLIFPEQVFYILMSEDVSNHTRQLLVNTAKYFRRLVFLFSFSDSDFFFWFYFMLGTMYEEPQAGGQDRDTLVASLAIWQGKD